MLRQTVYSLSGGLFPAWLLAGTVVRVDVICIVGMFMPPRACWLIYAPYGRPLLNIFTTWNWLLHSKGSINLLHLLLNISWYFIYIRQDFKHPQGFCDSMNSQKFNNVISLSNLVGKTQQITSKSCELNLEKYLPSLYYIFRKSLRWNIFKASIKILYTTFHNLIHRILHRPLHTSRVSSERSQESRVQKQGLRVPLAEKPSLGEERCVTKK